MENSGNLKDQIAQRVKEANNVLVTVSNNPSVDQLASAIGLTLLLNKLGKHATAVFSGQVPSTIEFLEPEKTLEKDTNSLRDFIIALDKSKADKLRYKVEDKLVKIFITPYRTSLSDKDLEFSQGDFNVDVVIALGVKQREQLDQAIVAHGRILHDATVISINTDNNVDLGTMNLVDDKASSLCEIVIGIVDLMQSSNLLDGQMATAFLTGIVAETDRFRNNKTSPVSMSVSSRLMAAGANQQLIASKLDEGGGTVQKAGPNDTKGPKSGGQAGDGALRIDHELKNTPSQTDIADSTANIIDQINIDDQGQIVASDSPKGATDKAGAPGNPKFVLDPPSLGGTLTANSRPEDLDPSTDAMSLPPVNSPLLTHDTSDRSTSSAAVPTNPLFGDQGPTKPVSLPPKPPQANPPADNSQPPANEGDTPTIKDLEQFVDSPHVHAAENASAATLPPAPPKEDTPTPSTTINNSSVEAARNAVDQAVASATQPPLEPIAALNANPLNLDLGHGTATNPTPTSAAPPVFPIAPSFYPPGSTPSASGALASVSNADTPPEVPPMNMPANLVPTTMPTDNTAAPNGQAAPPPVPPPMMPPSYNEPPK